METKFTSEKFDQMREKAEDPLKGMPVMETAQIPGTLDLMRELRAYQKELKIQNEELNHANQELSALKQEYVDLYEFAPCGYITINSECLITHANLTAVKLLGKDSKTLLRSGLSQFIHSDWSNKFWEFMIKAQNTGEKQILEIPLKTEYQGKPVWVVLDIKTDRNDAGEVVQWRIALEDITERKRAEEKLKEYSQNLEEIVAERTRELQKAQEDLRVRERLAMLGHFAGSVAHEIRNPLAIIESWVYLLNMNLKATDEKLSEKFQVIQRNVGRINDIIDSLQNLSRMEKPKQEKHNLAELIDETLATTGIIPGHIETQTSFPEHGVFVNVEAEQIRIAIKNILKNAVQAMEDSQCERPRIDIAVRRSDTGQAVLSITDNGPGIKPENLDKILEPLFSTKVHGFGFGLSIAKMVVENHEGSIRAESEPGKGARMIIRLPEAGG
jgi:PAS domain S-box-containing protein